MAVSARLAQSECKNWPPQQNFAKQSRSMDILHSKNAKPGLAKETSP
jgi:hypothetical protein